jgi:hypothetical protein
VELPATFSVSTGGGGAHYYFLTDEPLRKGQLGAEYRGIDFQGAGSYCVGPGSIHPNGKPYFIDSSDPIADMPPELIAMIKGKIIAQTTPSEGKFFDGSNAATHFSDVKKVPTGQRNNYLMQVAGSMRRNGLSFDAIAAALVVVNEEKCDPPGDVKSVRQIALNASKYQPTDTIEPIITESAPTKKGPNILGNIAKTDFEKGFSESLERKRGLVKSIAVNILDNCDRRYPQFAIAAAEAIISTCSQGGYLTPSLGGGHGSSTSLYQWLVAPSAAGKDAYAHAVSAYLSAVDSRILYAKGGSQQGFLTNFFQSNSGMFLQDEFQDFMAQMFAPGQNHVRGVEQTFKICYNDLPLLRGERVARYHYPDIINPRLSIFGVGTTAGYKKHLTAEAISGGLVSRFAMIPAIDIPFKASIGRRVTPSADEIEHLKSILDIGMTDEGRMQGDGRGELKKLQNSQEKGADPAVHKPQFTRQVNLRAEPDALARLMEINRAAEVQYKYFIKKNWAESDNSPGSVSDRSPRFVSKRSAIEAIGRDSPIVDLTDVENADQFVTLTTNWAIDKILSSAGENDFERLSKKISGFLRKQDKPATKTMLFRACGNNVNVQQINQAIEALAIKGELVLYTQRDGNQIMTIEDTVPSRGVYYGMRE